MKELKKYYWHLKDLIVMLSNIKNLRQCINPQNIPFIIINFNQLFYLQKLVNFAISRGFKKIIIIDNVSTYPPLLEYYKEIRSKVTIERMDKNYGHMVFFESQELLSKYGENFFILTDADIEPNAKLPKYFMYKLLWKLFAYYPNVLKVGFALRIDDIPKSFPAKEKVINWETKYWSNEIENDLYDAPIDTTFALYKPKASKYLNPSSNFYLALRLGGNFTAKHGGWYIDYDQLTDEQKFYINLANKSSSWLVKKEGKTNSDKY